jgi:hypothetical protein
MSAVVAAIGLLIGPLIITISDLYPYRSIGGKSRNCRGIDIGHPLLLRLIIVVRVIIDDYLIVTRRPKDAAVEVANKRRRVAHWGRPRGTTLLEHW